MVETGQRGRMPSTKIGDEHERQRQKTAQGIPYDQQADKQCKR
jgi:hypothetical protein